MNKYEIIKYSDNCFELNVNVSPTEQTIWLTQDQIALLFKKSRSTITEHINNIFDEGELEQMTSVGNSDKTNHRPTKLYNLDVILAVGYRVKSKRAIEFRKWATNVLKQYLIKGYAVSTSRTLVTNENYINLVHEVNNLKNDVKEIREVIKEKEVKPFVCYESEYYDGFSFINNLICSAKRSVTIVDGYADNSLLEFFINSKKEIIKTVVCHKPERISGAVLKRFIKQYGEIKIIEYKYVHDRFLLIDDDVYMLGTSLNSIGNKTSVVIKVQDINLKDIFKL